MTTVRTPPTSRDSSAALSTCARSSSRRRTSALPTPSFAKRQRKRAHDRPTATRPNSGGGTRCARTTAEPTARQFGGEASDRRPPQALEGRFLQLASRNVRRGQHVGPRHRGPPDPVPGCADIGLTTSRRRPRTPAARFCGAWRRALAQARATREPRPPAAATTRAGSAARRDAADGLRR